jgi:hypothetical protein
VSRLFVPWLSHRRMISAGRSLSYAGIWVTTFD